MCHIAMIHYVVFLENVVLGWQYTQNKSTEICGTQNLTLEQDDIICQSFETNKIL